MSGDANANREKMIKIGVGKIGVFGQDEGELTRNMLGDKRARFAT